MFIDKEIILNYKSKKIFSSFYFHIPKYRNVHIYIKIIIYYKITAGEGFGYNLILFYNLSIISTEKRKSRVTIFHYIDRV